MPGHALTPVSTFDGITVPDDGEPCVATAPGAPATNVTLEEVIQSLANRTEYVKNGPYHGFVETRSIRVSDSRVVQLMPYGRISLEASGTMRTYASGSTATTVTLPGLAANTWYYVYCYNDGTATLALEVSTDVPTNSLLFKSTDTTRAYLGCFRTDAGSLPIPMESVNGKYTLRAGFDAAAFTALTIVSVHTGARASYSHKAPLHARVVQVQARLNVNNDAALRYAELYHPADAIATYTLDVYGVGVGDVREFATVEIAAGQATQIGVFTSTASATAQVVLAGFTEGPRT
jgi:hypothetical protein